MSCQYKVFADCMRGTVVRSASAISRGTTPALRHPLSIAELRKTGNGIVRGAMCARPARPHSGPRAAIFTIAGATAKFLSRRVDLCGERGVLCVLVSGSFRERRSVLTARVPKGQRTCNTSPASHQPSAGSLQQSGFTHTLRPSPRGCPLFCLVMLLPFGLQPKASI